MKPGYKVIPLTGKRKRRGNEIKYKGDDEYDQNPL